MDTGRGVTEQNWSIFGKRLKDELVKQGISYRQFADKAGLTLTTVHRYANSLRIPRATEIIKSAEILGVTCDYMLGLSDDPHKTRDGWAKAGFHDLPSAQPEKRTDKCTETHGVCLDTIDRQLAIDAITRKMVSIPTAGEKDLMGDVNRIRAEDISVIKQLPPASLKIGHKINQHQYPAKWICSECGAKHFNFSDKFCSKCGANVTDEEEQPEHKCDTCKHEKSLWFNRCADCSDYELWEAKE